MSEHINPDVGEVVEEYQHFYSEANQWQSLIDDLRPGDPLLAETVTEAVKQLDAICPYLGELVCARGRGEIPVISDKGQVVGQTYFSEDIAGVHQGTQVREYHGPEDLEPHSRIMHMIVTDRATQLTSDGFELRKSEFFSYFLIEPDTQITPIKEIEAAFNPYYFEEEPAISIDDVVSQLIDYSERANRLVRSTEYRRFPKRKQATQLRGLVSEAEEVIRIRELGMSAQARYGFILQISAQQELHLVHFDLEGHNIKGKIIGLESLENIRLAMGKSIRRDADLLDRRAGLCFVVDPDKTMQADLEIAPRQALYLPISSQAYSLEFTS